MKKIKPVCPWEKGEGRSAAFHGGSYSLMITAVVLAILIVANVFVSALPASLTKYDISSAKLYSITSNTKVVVNGLKEDVTIYWIVQSEKEDDVIEHLLSKYESLSDHIQVVKKNPDVFPAFARQYTDETVQNNSLIVECGERSRFIGYSDIYVQEGSIYSYSYNTSFDGEGAITSAIDYVVREELPKVYVLEGHGESELPPSFREQIEKENMEVTDFSLLNVDTIPEEADCIVIYGPTSDISDEEKEMLADYVTAGGKLLVMAGPTEGGLLENLYSLVSDYGVEVCEGIVVEKDREHYVFQAPYMLLPDMAASEITDSLNARVNVEISNINMQNEMSKILSDLFEYGNEQFAAGKSSNDIDFNSKIIELLEDRLENNTPETISKTIEISFIKGNNGNWEIVTDTNIFDAITGGYVSFSQRLQSSLNIYTDENDINNLDE